MTHAIDPADHQQRAVLDIMVRVMMGDEDRTQCRERNAGASVLVSDAQAAIEHIGGAIAQHHVRSHFPGAFRALAARAGAGAEQHQFGPLRVLQHGLHLLRSGPGNGRGRLRVRTGAARRKRSRPEGGIAQESPTGHSRLPSHRHVLSFSGLKKQ
jgi:hypothetical protein